MSNQDRLLSNTTPRVMYSDLTGKHYFVKSFYKDGRAKEKYDITEYINTQKRLYAESVQEQADDMARFIAALLIQSGGSVKVTKRTLEEIPLPSSVNFERFDNIDGSIEFRLDELRAEQRSRNNA